VEPYIDFTGRITGYAVVDLDAELGAYDWRLSSRNIWKAEQMLIDHPHRGIRSSDARIDRLRADYYRFKRAFPDRKPIEYRGTDRWTELPREFL
jgi:hypothetical protein